MGNAIALGYASLVGYMLGIPKNIDVHTMWRLFIAAFTIGGSSNIINDYYDAPIDSMNKPWRPIPAGMIRARTAYGVAIVLAIMGIIISFTVSVNNGLIALGAFIASYLYSKILKKVFLIGNIIVAMLTGLTIIYGSIPSGLGKHVIVAALFAFILNLGREFIKGIEDIEGDKKYGVKTLATVLNPKVAYKASLLVLVTLICLSILPYSILGYSIGYLMLSLIGVDTVILLALVKASSLQPRDALKASRMLKISAFCGITAFLVEAINIRLSSLG